MDYTCNNCFESFTLGGDVKFCPYCGNRLNNDNTYDIDVLKYTLHHAFDEISDDFYNAEFEIAKKYIVMNDYKEIYKELQGCQNRKTLFKKLEIYIQKLYDDLDKFLKLSDEEFEKKLTDLHKSYVEKVVKIYALFTDRKPTFEDFSIKFEQNYEPQKLKEYFDLLKISYEKYKRCVNNTGLFTAFSTDQSYGKRSIFLVRIAKDDTPEFLKLDIDKEIEEIKKKNDIKYMGFLDENTDEHINAFWHAFSSAYNMLEFFRTPTIENFMTNDNALESRLLNMININSLENVEHLVKQVEEIYSQSTV